ncbi:MAG: hypothetical protein IKA28_03160, partial [Tidjanibacter sp.]|nr:hypothetical protein [Tidjanibacter sp.]
FEYIVTVSEAGAAGEEQTYTVSSFKEELGLSANTNIEKPYSLGGGLFTLSASKGTAGATSIPAFNNTNDQLRVYKNGTTITLSSENTIVKVVFTFNGNYKHITGANVGSYDTASYTWTGSANSITFINEGTDQARITGMTITYLSAGGGEGGDTPVVETLATPTGVEAIAVGKDVTIAWDEVANATSYYVTCGTQNATVTATEADFTMDDYDITYEISVVAKADGYNDSVAATTTVTTEADPNEGGGEGGGEGGESVEVLSEEFDNTTTADSSSAIDSSKFSNFSGATDKAYTSKYGGLKLGSSSAVGYITSKALDLSKPFTVSIDASRYTTKTSEIQIIVGSVTKTISSDELASTTSGTLKTFTFNFDAATANSTIKITTVAGKTRAYIDNVVVTVGN